MKFPTQLRNRQLFAGDLFLIVVAVVLSFVLRLEFGQLSLFLAYLPQALWMTIVALLIKPLVFYLFGLYRRLWTYASTQELKLIIISVTTASLLLLLGVMLLWPIGIFPGVIFRGFPRSVFIIDWLLSLIMIGGFRFALRLVSESRSKPEPVWGQSRRVLIVGAGDAGALVVREMEKNPQLGLKPICFLDDDPGKQNRQIHGIPVLGSLEELPRVTSKENIDEVIIALPSAPGRIVRQVAEACRKNRISFRTMPGMYELIGGQVSVNRLREVQITDLLRRKPAQINSDLVGKNLRGRRVMVTGAGGSIGSELCRQVARREPAELILLGHGENSIFEILIEIEELFPGLKAIPVISDIRNMNRLQSIFAKYQPEVIFHAAAYKHVVLMENNVEEAVTNNVLGMRNVVDASLDFDVPRLVMISTDKAVRPSSVMGATKRIAEMLVLDAAHRYNKGYSVVRFGNVLGSRGSVVPRFKRQIARGGPVTVTHPEMERFFMTIPEAVHLVLQTFAMGRGGEVFVLNMGKQVSILELAKDLIRLSGLEPEKDIEIHFTGIRPGEKLKETLWDEGSGFLPTRHPDVMRLIRDEHLNEHALDKMVDELLEAARIGNRETILRMLDEFIPGAAVQTTPPPDLTSVI